MLTRLQILAYVTAARSFCSALTAASTRAAVSRLWRSHRDSSQPGCFFLSCWRMLYAHSLCRVFPHGLDQIHLFFDQFAVSNQLLHLPFFRDELFPSRVLKLLVGPGLFLIDLISLLWIRRVPCTPYTNELGRAHVGNYACSTEHLCEGSDLAFSIFQHFPNLIRAAQTLGAHIDSIHKDHLCRTHHLRGRRPRVVFRNRSVALVKQFGNDLDRRIQVSQLGRKRMAPMLH